MTLAPDFPSIPADDGDPAPGRPGHAPVLHRVPVPVGEPPFDDELGLLPAARSRLPATGRVVYLTRTPAVAAAAAGVPELAALVPAGIAAAPLTPVASAGAPAGGAAADLPATATPARSDPSMPAPARLHLVETRVRPPARPGRSGGSRDAVAGRTGGTTPQRPALGRDPVVVVDTAARRSRMLGIQEESLPVPVPAMPDPRPLATQIVQAVVEVLAGDRQVTQLVTWVDEEVYAAVAAAAPAASRVATAPLRRTTGARIRPQDRPMVRSVHLFEPVAGVAEVTARVQTGGRSRAVALRLEEWRGRWRCNALTVG